MRTRLFSFIITLCVSSNLLSQEITQTVRGKIYDEDNKMPLIGASVQVVGSDPIVGSTTDLNGAFRIEQVAIGRLTLKVSYIGYEDRVIPNLLVSGAKEVVLDISLIESIEQMDEIVVSVKQNKAEVLNEMSVVSARSFSVDETKRYAGSFADPARMVSSFAGVTNDPEGNNDIIVRGNSPRGILWRLEGVEIPNPNHFANEGATGGPINALNSNMLSDSDFMSGAFAPEYGNAISGVFDMKLKKGNNQTREYTTSASTLGIDFTAEGPFKKGYNGSYIVNYRYSSLGLIDNLGIMDFGGVPKYQDVSFNINLPIDRRNTISVFGLGGKSGISDETKLEDSDDVLSKATFFADMGVVGLNHNLLINKKTYIRTSLSMAGTRLEGTEDVPNDEDVFYKIRKGNLKKSFIRLSPFISYKFNARNKVETGAIYTRLAYNLDDDRWNNDLGLLEKSLQDKGSSYTLQGFSTWKYRMTNRLTFTGGLHYFYFGLNNSNSIEPRAALKWKASNQSSLTAGFGLHSRMESVSVYLSKRQDSVGTIAIPNRNLEVAKAAHYVLGYDHTFSANTHFKAEIYYQSLYDVPIESLSGSTYSLLNSVEDYSNRTLVNEGTGRNYGLELTMEKYLSKGFYYLVSTSLYESLYTARDGVERKTRFAGNYTFNVLGGKEWRTGSSSKNKVLFINSKISLIGGKRYTPIDLERSIEAGYEVEKADLPLSVKANDLLIVNLSIGTRRNKNHTTREFKLDLQNATNNQAVVGESYIDGKKELNQNLQLPLFPTLSYTISF